MEGKEACGKVKREWEREGMKKVMKWEKGREAGRKEDSGSEKGKGVGGKQG